MLKERLCPSAFIYFMWTWWYFTRDRWGTHVYQFVTLFWCAYRTFAVFYSQ